MWLKLGNEHLNLDHVVRVRFNKGWKNGQDELVAEVEGFVKGEVQIFTRYRNRDAEVLQNVLETLNIPGGEPVTIPAQPTSVSKESVPVHAAATTNTVAEI
jgi:hypothetical protein